MVARCVAALEKHASDYKELRQVNLILNEKAPDDSTVLIGGNILAPRGTRNRRCGRFRIARAATPACDVRALQNTSGKSCRRYRLRCACGHRVLHCFPSCLPL